MGGLGFRVSALLWLPAGIIAEEVLRSGSVEQVVVPSPLVELLPAAPCGIPLAPEAREVSRTVPGRALRPWRRRPPQDPPPMAGRL